MLELLFFIFIIATLIQVSYYLFFLAKFSFVEKHNSLKRDTPVSVIIAARNEAKNLKLFLPHILAQNHLNFEIVLVDDASTDDTHQVLNSIKSNNLRVITISGNHKYGGNKKKAITKGIEAAKYETLLFTDADCCPVSENWISEMTSKINNNKHIVLGYGAYEKQSSSINKLIRYETLLTAIQYFSYAKIGIPYMGVGRNLAYKKELFSKVDGFSSHSTIRSGDDDLFVNMTANKNNTALCLSKNSFTVSKPKETFGEWFKQKRRHISTAKRYKPIHKFLLGLFYLSQLSFWALAIILLMFSFNWQLVTILVIIRLMLHYITIYNSGLKLNEKDLFLLAPILDIILVFSQLGLFVTNLVSKPKTW